eukprot:SAG31_NODE_4371_length_3302_cov_6.276616_3_plen_78_part_00
MAICHGVGRRCEQLSSPPTLSRIDGSTPSSSAAAVSAAGTHHHREQRSGVHTYCTYMHMYTAIDLNLILESFWTLRY